MVCPHQAIPSGSIYGELTVYQLKKLPKWVLGLNLEYFVDQRFKTPNHFQNDQISLLDSSPRSRHTKLRLRAAALL
jgi:hypothetical protein